MVRGLMWDEEWAFFEPFVVRSSGRSGRPPADHRRMLDGVFWIARTGVPWGDLHEHFGKWLSVYRRFRRWALSGVWDAMMAALNTADAVPSSVAMIDSTIVRAHQHSAGVKEGLRARVSGAQEVAARQRSTWQPTGLVFLSPLN
jgi:transposase